MGQGTSVKGQCLQETSNCRLICKEGLCDLNNLCKAQVNEPQFNKT